MLKISNLEVNYGKMQVIKGISLEVKEGELISVIGPNGAGKTTLIRTIMGLKKAASGSIFFEDKDITALPAWKRAIWESDMFPRPARLRQSDSGREPADRML